MRNELLPGRYIRAYQEELITLEQLRERVPELRKQEQAVH
jgi:hypothetical protein